MQDSSGNYLGLPSSFLRSKHKDLKGIADKIWKAIQGWKRSFFSVAGKEVLIKSVGQAIPTFAMSLFQLPKKLCEEITRCFARFWWGSTEENRKIHWKSWNSLCLLKSLGGLNFRDLTGFNQSLVAKQVWRILTYPMLLASKVLKSIYFPNTSLLEADLGNNPSYLWKSFLWGRDLLKLGLRFRIGNGKTIKVFTDPWIPRTSTFKPLTMNDDLLDATTTSFIDEGKWDINKLTKIFNPEDINQIIRLPIHKNLEDKWIWHFDKKGLYSVKSGYKSFVNSLIREASSSENCMGKIWEKLWRLKVPNKIKFFCWRALNEIIRTKVTSIKKA